ncbi:proline-rich receptor-like protein kinase PERK1 [Hevea brasiliensis]|uniref:proline-rich receptor-like protein kinase PERK1 n=1 Tax=Hevea brasiliensis TaxID=3981 RepID=UPI0025F1109F|nr:proline-rich receptor-like protein kinase PERK1 [Hevea brasiliensis]
MTSESKSLIRGDSSETMIPAQFGVDTETSESKSLIEGDPLETMIPAQFREMRSLPKDYEAYELRKFTFPELAIATGHFTNARFLGGGGFCAVYRGSLPQGKEVAIERLYFQLDGQQQEEIEKEINAVGNVRHENLVKLIGYCREDFDTCLVLEFVPNNSLRFHLNDEERRSNLKWSERMKIAIGSAKGLAYLHEECNPKIIHRDIKAKNILLDDNCEPKVE